MSVAFTVLLDFIDIELGKMKSRIIILAFTAVSLLTSVAQAAYLTESHVSNDTFATSQFIDSIYFDSNFDRDINEISEPFSA